MRFPLLFASLLSVAVVSAAIDDATAAKAAMAHAGVKEVGLRALYAAPDEEDGRLIYDVRFHDGVSAYVYEVLAHDGSILKARRHALPKLAEPRRKIGGDIGADRAKAVALADAKVVDAPLRVKVERDFERGRLVYEVEFRSGGQEHEYVIDAADGAILKRESERARAAL